MKGVDGGYDTNVPDRADRTDRDKRAVIGVCAIADARGDEDGRARTEVLMALGLHPLALAMRDGTPLPRRADAGRTKLVLNDPAGGGETKRSRRRRLPGEPIDHGTNRGYAQHRTEGSDPCEACAEAHCDYSREYARTLTTRRATS